MDDTAISIRLPKDLLERLKAAAQAEERTVSQHVRFLLDRALAEREAQTANR